MNYAKIPAVNVLLQSEQGKSLVEQYSHEVVVVAIRAAITKYREGQAQVEIELQDYLLKEAAAMLVQKFAPSLKRTINATGTVIHTNLGRAKLSPYVQEALIEAGFSFSNLEYDVERGSRGSRYQHLEAILCELTGSEAALVVNNNAAAVMLALSALAKEKAVIVSRGELVEIGGSFRIPEIIQLSGCHLREVGTTNKTHAFDYERAIAEETAAILKVHTSNYKISGFTENVKVEELARLAHKKAIPLIHDMGSGMLINLERYGLIHEMTVQESLAAGADIVTFSGDKVLGGPQAGILVGKKKYIDAMKKNQLTRALRVDKMTIATLEATLRLYYDEQEAIAKIPTLQMLVASLEELEQKANDLKRQLSILQEKALIEVIDTYSQVGGGAYPGEEIKSKAVAISPKFISANQLSESLRQAVFPIVTKIRNQKCEFDLRTIERSEFSIIAETLTNILDK